MIRHAYGLAAMVIAAGCGSSSNTNKMDASVAANPPINLGDDDSGFRTLVDLTLSERKALCDWSAQVTGGYGKVTACESGIVINHQNQAVCISQYLAACYSVKVTQWVECQKKIAADPCALPLYNAPECKPVLKCVGLIDGGPPPPPEDGGM